MCVFEDLQWILHRKLYYCFITHAQHSTSRKLGQFAFPHHKLKVNEKCTEQVLKAKYLSILLKSHLKFEKHVKIMRNVAKANTHTFRLQVKTSMMVSLMVLCLWGTVQVETSLFVLGVIMWSFFPTEITMDHECDH